MENSVTSTFSGSNNIGIGEFIFTPGAGDITGSYNIGIGYQAIRNMSGGGITGNENIALGHRAMDNFNGNVGGDQNVAIGSNALYSNGGNGGSNNIGIGYNTLYSNILRTGNQNIAIGYYAGSNLGQGNGNIFLGNQSMGADTAGQPDNIVAIGNGMQISSTQQDNVILLGNDDVTNPPKIGMGTYQPKAKLHVTGEVIVGDEGGNCTSDNVGAIRFQGGHFYGCNGSTWKQLDN